MKNIVCVAVCSIASISQLYAVNVSASITKLSSDDVDYDGSKVKMSGSVQIEHMFGSLRCDRAVLLLEQFFHDCVKEQSVSVKSNEFLPRRIILQGAVEVYLRDGSVLSSEEADIDCVTLDGVFTAKEPKKVVYTSFQPTAGTRSKMTAEGQCVRVKMVKPCKERPEYTFTRLYGQDAVQITYEQEESDELSDENAR